MAPAKYRLKLVRQGNAVAVSIAKDGADLKELGHTQVPLGNPVLVGLAVCSHKADASDTVVFSDVSIRAARAAGRQGSLSVCSLPVNRNGVHATRSFSLKGI